MMLINPKTKTALKSWMQNPSTPLCLETGAPTDRSSIIEATLRTLEIEPFSVHTATITGATIPIEEVRAIRRFLRLKSAGNKEIRRAIVMHKSQFLNVESQNALLKILEELPSDCVFMVTIDNINKLKPTLRSRFWICRVLPVSLPEALLFYQGEYSESEVKQAYIYSRGNPELIDELMSDDTEQLKRHFDYAKQVLGMQVFDRLAQVEHTLNSYNAHQHLYALKIILLTVLNKLSKQTGSQQKSIRKVTQSLSKVNGLESRQTVTKLALIDLYLSF